MNQKPIRALFGSRNSYRGALAQWIQFHLKKRQERKRAKRQANKQRRVA